MSHPASPHRPRLALAAAALLVLASGLAACTGEDAQGEACVAAFRNAEPRALPPYQATALDDAVRECGTYDAWVAAWDRVPGAHPDHDDPRAFLADRCATDDLARVDLCRDIAGS